MEFNTRVVNESDHKHINEFLSKFFLKDEPLIKSLETSNQPIVRKFTPNDEMGISECTVVAEHHGKLVGVCLNAVKEREKKEKDFEPHNEEIDRIGRLLDYVIKEAKAFEYFPKCNRAMNIKIVSVDTNYRGKGIAKKMIAKTMEIARNQECGFIMVECTSYYTARAVQTLGFKQIYSLKYSDWKPDGELVFEPELPHSAVGVYVMDTKTIKQ